MRNIPRGQSLYDRFELDFGQLEDRYSKKNDFVQLKMPLPPGQMRYMRKNLVTAAIILNPGPFRLLELLTRFTKYGILHSGTTEGRDLMSILFQVRRSFTSYFKLHPYSFYFLVYYEKSTSASRIGPHFSRF